MAGSSRKHVVIIGGGFGGLSAARALRRANVDITLIDRTNHHLFQPLLYQVATASLAETNITAPIRWLLRHQPNTRVLMAEVERIDPATRAVQLNDGREVRYDYLVVAAGARHSYFGHPEWEPLAPGLKSVGDALEMRRRFLLAYERAEVSQDPVERDALMTFVIVGGGPTGVELAGMLPTIAKRTMRRDYRTVDTATTRVVLVEGGPRILPTFPENLAARARHDLEALGVEVRTNQIVTSVESGEVRMGEERIATRTVFWAAGNAASPLGASLGVPIDRVGRVQVEPDLSIPGHPEVFVVGDLAAIMTDGQPVPGVAPAAMQGGKHAARMIRRDLEARARVPFRYRNKGDLATIGRNSAIAKFGERLELTGFIAWIFWLFVHILYLAGFRNRVSVLIEWGFAYLTYQRGARLVVAPIGGDAPATSPVLVPRW